MVIAIGTWAFYSLEKIAEDGRITQLKADRDEIQKLLGNDTLFALLQEKKAALDDSKLINTWDLKGCCFFSFTVITTIG